MMMMIAAIMWVVVVMMILLLVTLMLVTVAASVDICTLQVFKKSVGDHGEITLSGFKSIVQSKNVIPTHIHNIIT